MLSFARQLIPANYDDFQESLAIEQFQMDDNVDRIRYGILSGTFNVNAIIQVISRVAMQEWECSTHNDVMGWSLRPWHPQKWAALLRIAFEADGDYTAIKPKLLEELAKYDVAVNQYLIGKRVADELMKTLGWDDED